MIQRPGLIDWLITDSMVLAMNSCSFLVGEIISIFG